MNKHVKPYRGNHASLGFITFSSFPFQYIHKNEVYASVGQYEYELKTGSEFSFLKCPTEGKLQRAKRFQMIIHKYSNCFLTKNSKILIL